MIEALPTLSGIGALAGAVWLWRFAALASYLKVFAVGTVGLFGAGMLGIVEISVNPGRILELIQGFLRLLVELGAI